MAKIELLHGESGFKNTIPTFTRNGRSYTIEGKFQNRYGEFELSDDILSRNLLLLGAAGSGKSTAIFQILSKIKKSLSANDVVLIFDTKEDYYDRFHDQKSVIISNAYRFRDQTAHWNIFKDMEADITNGSDTDDSIKDNAREISSVLFEGRGSEAQPFFVNAAKDLFASLLVGYYRACKVRPTGRSLTNYGFLEFYQNLSSFPSRFSEFLKNFDDLTKAISYIGDGSSGQAQGVLGEMSNMVADIFTGSFASPQSANDFSIRSLIRSGEGKTIFLEYDMNQGESLVPIYRLLIDLALKEALSRKGDSQRKRNVWIIADEFRLLPRLKHIDDALNFGRSFGIKVIAGIQTIKQLEAGYGEARASSIAAGFSSTFVFRLNDSDSRTFSSELFGRSFKIFQYYDNAGHPITREREGYVVEPWDWLSINGPGFAMIRIDGNSPFLFRFKEMP